MHNLTDYQLVTSYQDTKDAKYFNTLYDRYFPLINKHTRQIHRSIKYQDRTVEHQDIYQDLKLLLHEILIERFDRKRIQDINGFCFYMQLLNEIRNYRTTLSYGDIPYSESIETDIYSKCNPISDYTRMMGLVDEFYDILPGNELRYFSHKSYLGISVK